MSAAPGRLRAAVIDEALAALAAALVYAMALQTGVTALLALPASRLLAPLAGLLGAGLVPLTVTLMPVVFWAFVRLVFRVVGSGSPAGQTPGKRVTGLRVERATDGEPPGYRRAAVRELVLLVEVLTVVGLAAALARRPWHDVAAGTRVRPVPTGDGR